MADYTLIHNHKGFTLIEIITILVIVGILSILAASRISINNTDLLSAQAALKSHIRHTQSKAMQRAGTVWGLRFDPALDEYWVFSCPAGTGCAWTTGRSLPFGAEASSTNFNNDRIKTSRADIDISRITVGTTEQTRLTLVFDVMGVPFWLTDTTITFSDPLENSAGLTRAAGDITIRLTDTSANTADIIISSESGFIP